MLRICSHTSGFKAACLFDLFSDSAMFAIGEQKHWIIQYGHGARACLGAGFLPLSIAHTELLARFATLLLLFSLFLFVVPVGHADGNCPMLLGSTDQADNDGDGVGDVCDNCLSVTFPNPEQRDTDADGFGNICDPDFNNNLAVNAGDLGYLKSVFFTTDPHADLDGSGVVNAADLGILKSFFFKAPGPTGVIPRLDNTRPLANAGPDQVVSTGAMVTLDASATTDLDGGPLNYLWTLTASPAGSSAVLSNPNALMPGFTADLAGDYEVLLTVFDGTATSAPDTVIISTANVPPVAHAGRDQSASISDTITLDGSASTDVDGDRLTYLWSLEAVPAGSGATLSNPAAIMPDFQVDLLGEYISSLIVNDGSADSAPDTVTITTGNAAPVADAGPDQSIAVSNLVQLDGTGSSDANSNPLSYLWSLSSIPAASTTSLDNPTLPGPSFTADVPGTYIGQLIVNDVTADSEADTVVFTTDNVRPVANAGADQIGVSIGNMVVLDGSGSSDADGAPSGFRWALIERPAGSSAALVGQTTVAPGFVPDIVGMYIVQLIVDDIILNSAPDTAVVTTSIPDPAMRLEIMLLGVDPALVPIASANDLLIRALDASGFVAKLFAGSVLLTSSDTQPPLHNLLVNFTPGDFGEVTLAGQGLFTTLGAVTVSASSPPLTDALLNVNVVMDAPVIYPAPGSSASLDGSLAISGFSFPGEQVDLFVDGQLLDSATAGVGGEFTFTLTLDAGSHNIFVKATDPVTSNTLSSAQFAVAGPTGQEFPLLTSAAQEPVMDDADADAAVTYPADGSVILNSGEKRLDRSDLAIPGRGQINFDFYRRYRSQINYDGPLGFGWDFSYNERLVLSSNGNIVRANGMGHVDTWGRNPDNSFTPPTGYFGTLSEEMDGTFILRETDGFKRTYSAAGRLLQYQDRFSNTMLFAYDVSNNLTQITDAFGRIYTLSYQNIAGRDRLSTLQDYSGRQVIYSYDANGDLGSVRSPVVTGTSTSNDFPVGRSEAYSYTSGNAQAVLNHNLLTITYPEEVSTNGPVAVTCTYGDTGINLDRVLTMTMGGTNVSGIVAGGTVTFVYEAMNQAVPPGDADVARLKVSVTERNGNEIAYFINEYEHLKTIWQLTQGLHSGEPAYYETSFYYDVDGQKTADVLAEDNRIQYTYDNGGPRAAQRNLLEIRQLADFARGGGADLVTSYSYEPVFNQVSTRTDPRGNAIGFIPPIGVASAARYTSRYFYDYQENNDAIPDAVKYSINLTGIARNLGDLNSDGASNQIAGNRVRTKTPAVLLLAGSNEAARIGGTSQQILTETQWNDRGQKTAIIDPEGNLTTLGYHPENDPDGDGSTVPGQVSSAPKGYLETSTVDATPAPARRTAAASPAVLENMFGYDAVGNITSIHNPRGVVTAYEVNQLNETIVATRGADIAQAVASNQLITGETAFAYRTRNHYDLNGRVILSETENVAAVSTTAGVGDWVERSYIYDILDNVVTSTVEADASTTIVTQSRYDGNELLIQVVKPEGNAVKIDYDERNLKFRVHNGFGAAEVAIMQYDYDLNGNVVRKIDAEDNDSDGNPESTLYSYDGFDRRTVITDALGNQAISSYDPASNIVRLQQMGHPANQPAFANVLLSDLFYSHDELDRRYQVDEQLFLADGFEPLRPEDLRDRNSDGLVTTLTEYDALSRKTFAVDDDGDTDQLVYDGANRVIETIDALNNRNQYSYDKNNNFAQKINIEVSPESLVPNETFITRYVYDQLDRRVRVTDNAGRTSRFAYDSRDNLTTSSDGVGPMLGSDPLGLYPGAINDAGNTITSYYDGRDLQVREVSDLRTGGTGGAALDTSNSFNADGQITVRYLYDGNSRQVALIDDNGNTTSYGYDALDRQTSKTNADTTQFTYGYDRDSNQTSVVDPNGNQTTNTFDVLNRLLQRNITRARDVVGTTVENYNYDGISRLTFSSDNNGAAPSHKVDRIYDSLSRLLEEQEDGEPHSSVWSGDGNRLQLLYPTSRIIDYEYDANDRIKRAIEPFPEPLATATASVPLVTIQTTVVPETIVDYSWIGGGSCHCHCPCESRPLLLAMGNGTQMSFLDNAGTADIGYNLVREPVSLRHLFGSTELINRSYTYNRAYMRTSEQFLDFIGSPTNVYALDSAYRGTTTDLAADGSPEAFSTQVDYTLDGVGNRHTVDFLQDFGGGATFGFSNNYLSNIMNEYDDTGGGGGPRGHDNNGNLTSANGFVYKYDYRNRLVEVRRQSDQVIRASYEYDTFNRRVTKKLYNLASPGTVLENMRYFYDNWNVIEEWLPEPDYSDNGPAATYVYGVNIDKPVQMITSLSHAAGAGRFYYHRDVRDNVVAMTDPAGVVVEKTRYDDFGNFEQSSSIGNPYLFQGRRYDSETGFFYYRNRYYDPLTGRFLQRDPVWDPGNMGNQYTFVGNNPLSGMDPYGLWTIQIGIEFGGGFFGPGGKIGGGIVIQFGGGELIDLGLYGATGTGLMTGAELGASVQAGFSNSSGSTIEELDGSSISAGGTVAIGPGISGEQSTPTGTGPSTTSIGVGAGAGAEGHIYRTDTATTGTLGDAFRALGDWIFSSPPPVIPPAQTAAQARRLQTDAKIRAMKKAKAAAASKKAFTCKGTSLLDATESSMRDEAKAKAKAKADARKARARARAEAEAKRHQQGVTPSRPGNNRSGRSTGVTTSFSGRR